MKSVKLLSMTFLLLGFGKVGFVKCLLNGEPYKGVDVLRDEMFKKKYLNVIFPYNYATH